MNCPKCNTENTENAKFCMKCGAPIAGEQPNDSPYDGNPPLKQSAPLNKNKVKIAGIIVVCLVILLVGIISITNRKHTIDLSDYISVGYGGYEGYGMAYLEWDNKKYVQAFSKALGADADDFYKAVESNDVAALEKLLDDDIDAEKLLKMIYEIYESPEIDKSLELKNGDTVTVSIKFDNEDAAEFGMKFKGAKKEFQVSGLGDVRAVNPFDYLEVSYEGISPSGRILLKKKDSEEMVMEAINFETEQMNNLKVGDKVTVTAKTWADDQQLMTRYGCTLSETSKEFTVEGIAEYISDAAELENDELFAQLKSQTEDAINAYFAEEQASISQSDLKYEGYYFLNAKEVNYYEYNKIDIVYSATITSKDKYNKFNPTKVYFPFEFKNIIKGTDGKMTVDLNRYTRQGGISLGYKWMNGYTDLTSMKNALVVTEGAKFECTYGGVLK